MTELDHLICRLSWKIKDQLFAIEAMKQENAALKARVAELEAEKNSREDGAA